MVNKMRLLATGGWGIRHAFFQVKIDRVQVCATLAIVILSTISQISIFVKFIPPARHQLHL
jgi:hypothetical protein